MKLNDIPTVPVIKSPKFWDNSFNILPLNSGEIQYRNTNPDIVAIQAINKI